MARALDRSLVVVPSDPAWPQRYEEEAARVRAALGADLVALEHIGSTAIAGLAAKPVLDLVAGCRTRELTPEAVDALRALGYRPRSRGDRRYFRKGTPRTHTVHVVEHGGAEWRRKLAHRGYLRADARAAAAYAELKQTLAATTTRGGYARGKGRFFRELESSLAYEAFVAAESEEPVA